MPSTIPPFVLPAATGNPYPTFSGAQQTGVELTGQPTTQPAPLPPITQAEREQIQQRVEQQRKSNSDFLKQIEALRQWCEKCTPEKSGIFFWDCEHEYEKDDQLEAI